MNTLPPIGARVKYRHESKYIGLRECTGEVVKHYPGYEYRDNETGEINVVPDHVSIRVDAIPDWWPYPDTDRFAPSIDEVELIKLRNVNPSGRAPFGWHLCK